jgi:hypothetical protein
MFYNKKSFVLVVSIIFYFICLDSAENYELFLREKSNSMDFYLLKVYFLEIYRLRRVMLELVTFNIDLSASIFIFNSLIVSSSILL